MFSIVLGANSAAVTSNATIASQIGRKRAATRALATTWEERPRVAPSLPLPSAWALKDRPIRNGRTVKSEPRSGVHSAHLRRGVSTVTERRSRAVHLTRTSTKALNAAATRFSTDETRQAEVAAHLGMQ